MVKGSFGAHGDAWIVMYHKDVFTYSFTFNF